MLAAFADRPEVREVLRFLLSPEFGCRDGSERPWLPVPGSRVRHEPLRSVLEASRQSSSTTPSRSTTFRFDASDLMPVEVGERAFWEGMLTYLDEGPGSADRILENIEASWPDRWLSAPAAWRGQRRGSVRVRERDPGKELEAGGEPRRVPVRDRGRHVPVAESPRDDLSTVLVRAIIPGNSRLVPCAEAAHLDEAFTDPRATFWSIHACPIPCSSVSRPELEDALHAHVDAATELRAEVAVAA